ncbi:hypothetical protein [Comamonas sp. lk]|uniref:hypothetical protein n=1 Tax=Comamonas sp. lk TaxID=2201272 RepID=UPI0013CF0D1A|nr:hypothetical protein [Comamonas sp. lk]
MTLFEISCVIDLKREVPGVHGCMCPASSHRFYLPTPMSCRLPIRFFLLRHSGLRLLSRIMAAVFGGYLLTSVWIVWCGALGSALGSSRAEAILVGMQSGFVLYPVIIAAVFLPISLRSAWLCLLLPSAALAAMAACMTGWGG